MKGSALSADPDDGVLARRVPLVVTVFGRPVTQGAIRSLGKGRPSVHANAGRLRPWREAVKQSALDAMGSVTRDDGTGGVGGADVTEGVSTADTPGVSTAMDTLISAEGVHAVDTLSPGSGKKGVRSPHPLEGGRLTPPLEGSALSAYPWQRLEGPVLVDMVFTFDRPKSAPKSRRVWPTTRSSGDLDKLVRAVGDALVDAGVMRDDSQVVRLTAEKLHVGDPGALRIPGAVVQVSAVSA